MFLGLLGVLNNICSVFTQFNLINWENDWSLSFISYVKKFKSLLEIFSFEQAKMRYI
jgi:hypothetical protein